MVILAHWLTRMGIGAVLWVVVWYAASGVGSLATSTTPNNSHTLSLIPPPFLTIAHAQEGVSPNGFDLSTYLDEEAGFSAYYKTTDPITLSQVRPLYRTIEIETNDFILGSIAVPDYEDYYDAHVYIHRDGWILAFYFNDEPISKSIDIRHNAINTTTLANVVSVVAGAAGSPYTGAEYYDFRYPNATNILFVYEDGSDGNSYSIEIPSEYAYFERGFAIIGGEDRWFHLNGVEMPAIYDSNGLKHGSISASQLTPGIEHQVSVSFRYGNGAGILMLLYRVP